jgi:benzoyl-CoA reductase subunit BamC
MCVKWCFVDAITYEEFEEEVKEEVEFGELDMALEALIDRYGWEKVSDAFGRMLFSKMGEEGL